MKTARTRPSPYYSFPRLPGSVCPLPAPSHNIHQNPSGHLRGGTIPAPEQRTRVTHTHTCERRARAAGSSSRRSAATLPALTAPAAQTTPLFRKLYTENLTVGSQVVRETRTPEAVSPFHPPAHSALLNREGPRAVRTSLPLACPASRSLAGAVPKLAQALSKEAAGKPRACVASLAETDVCAHSGTGRGVCRDEGSAGTPWGTAPATAAPGFREQCCAHKAEAAGTAHSALHLARFPESCHSSQPSPAALGESPAYNMQEK